MLSDYSLRLKFLFIYLFIIYFFFCPFLVLTFCFSSLFCFTLLLRKGAVCMNAVCMNACMHVCMNAVCMNAVCMNACMHVCMNAVCMNAVFYGRFLSGAAPFDCGLANWSCMSRSVKGDMSVCIKLTLCNLSCMLLVRLHDLAHLKK